MAVWTLCDMRVYWEVPGATHLCIGSLGTRCTCKNELVDAIRICSSI